MPASSISPPSSRKAGQWAVLISEPSSHENYFRLTTEVASVVAESGHSTVAIFRPSATHGKVFDELFEADPTVSRMLHKYCDEIFVGKVTSAVETNPISPGLLKLTLMIDIKIVSTSTGMVQRQHQAFAIGAGYDVAEARTNAEENLAVNLQSELRTSISRQ